jgi:tRNA threonylcarbamoyladenosine biosynthesis protein TsaB
MNLLALETATSVCSVALWIDGGIIERSEIDSKHSERILAMVQAVLADGGVTLSNLDAIAFGRGPGSFTGLRLGAGVAQGLALGADLPVLPVSTLAALAQTVNASKVLAVLDARMNQVYWGAYVRREDGSLPLQAPEGVASPQALPLPDDERWTGLGSGWDVYGAVLKRRLGAKLETWLEGASPSAHAVAKLGLQHWAAGIRLAPEQALPVYLRDDVAIKTRDR